MSDALIHLRVPAGLKARWVRQSRAAGMRLTDWIIQKIEGAAMQANITIPAGIDFSSLQLQRKATGHVSFSVAVIEQIEAASGLPTGFFMGQDEDAIADLIVTWYSHHLAAGGARNQVADELIAEVRSEDAAGQMHSHKPGRA